MKTAIEEKNFKQQGKQQALTRSERRGLRR